MQTVTLANTACVVDAGIKHAAKTLAETDHGAHHLSCTKITAKRSILLK